MSMVLPYLWFCICGFNQPQVQPTLCSTAEFTIEKILRTSVVVQWLRLHTPNAGVLSSIPSQGTRTHMLQLKIPHATTKIQHSKTNKRKKEKNLCKSRPPQFKPMLFKGQVYSVNDGYYC